MGGSLSFHVNMESLGGSSLPHVSLIRSGRIFPFLIVLCLGASELGLEVSFKAKLDHIKTRSS